MANEAQMPSVQILTISEDREGQRLDNFLFNTLKGVPKTHVYRLLRTGQVRINGKRCKPDSRIHAGDLVRVPPVRVPEPRDPGLAPERLLREVPGWIVFEDRHYLVFNKPSGIAAHGGSGISFGAIELLRQARPEEAFELVHRLDRDTSGVLVFAKKRPALTQLQTEIRENRIRKRYFALLAGRGDEVVPRIAGGASAEVVARGRRIDPDHVHEAGYRPHVHAPDVFARRQLHHIGRHTLLEVGEAELCRQPCAGGHVAATPFQL